MSRHDARLIAITLWMRWRWNEFDEWWRWKWRWMERWMIRWWKHEMRTWKMKMDDKMNGKMNGTWNGTGSKLIITWNTIFGGMNIHDFVAIFGTHQSTVWFWRVFTHCHSHTRTTGQDLIVESSSGTVGLFPKSAIWARFESHLWLYNYIYTHIHVCVNMGNICLSA